jgi:hypothetical protein
MKDYYKVLGVSPTANEHDIKRAYRKLALQYHPDKNPDPTVEQFFKEVNEAYDVLGDTSNRREYDYTRQNPFREMVQAAAEPQHRDPAYRRRPSPRNQSRGATNLELMARYLPYVKWMIWTGLGLFMLLVLDYYLPVITSQETITAIRVYTGKRGSHTIVETSGPNVKLHAGYFTRGSKVDIQYTPIFRTVLNISDPKSGEEVGLSGIYGPVFFLPMILFLSSSIGIFLRKNVEYAFNISIGNGLLILVVIYMIFVI